MSTGEQPKPKHAGGRPTKYKKRYCQDLIEYFSIDPTKIINVEYTNKKGETWTKEELAANSLRFLSAFGRSIGVCHDTLLEWCTVHPEFSASYVHAKAMQKEHLIECGLLGLYSGRFAVFTAKNIAGMRESQDIHHSGSVELKAPIIR